MRTQGAHPTWIVVAGFIVVLGLARPASAGFFACAAGDVACLIASINMANANGEVNLLRLAAGTFTLTAVNNDTDGSNGLPSITSALTIGGDGSMNTIIERDSGAPLFRVFHVGQSGSLNLEDLTVRGGRWGGFVQFGGGGVFNRGTTIITHCAVTDNATFLGLGGGGGIASLGRLFIAGSTVENNVTSGPGGGLFSTEAVTVINSTIRHNFAQQVGGGIAIANAAGSVTIIGSTIVDNSTETHGGGLYSDSPAVAIVNSTVARNRADGFGGGLVVAGGVVVNTTIAGDNNISEDGRALVATSALALHNTIVSGPPFFPTNTCRGQVTSLDNNIFLDPACAVTLLPHDRTGDPGLGDFIDFGVPGRGFFLLATNSQALDAADNAACLPSDQRGILRTGAGCDIGAVEGTSP